MRRWWKRAAEPRDERPAAERFEEDYLGRFDHLHRVTQNADVYVTDLNMGMFHQGALRYATQRAEARGDVIPNLEQLAQALYVKAHARHPHLHP